MFSQSAFKTTGSSVGSEGSTVFGLTGEIGLSLAEECLINAITILPGRLHPKLWSLSQCMQI